MPKIKRALKCAAVKEQLKEVLEIAEKTEIKGLEVQEILPLINEKSFEERGRIIIDVFKKYSLNSLAYHFPLPPKNIANDLQKARLFDIASNEGEYIFDLTEETIKEAAFVGKELKISSEIPVVVHLFGFVSGKDADQKTKERRLKIGEERLKKLKEKADYCSRKFKVKLTVARENNPPEHEGLPGLLDFHPKEIVRTADLGIANCLDLAHIWLSVLYWKYGKGELPGADLSKILLPDISLEETAGLIAPSLALLHLNDAGPGFMKVFEGLEAGKGDFPHSFFIPLIYSKLKKDIIGTYEMKYGHLDAKSMLRSDQFYRNLFKEKFSEYFD